MSARTREIFGKPPKKKERKGYNSLQRKPKPVLSLDSSDPGVFKVVPKLAKVGKRGKRNAREDRKVRELLKARSGGKCARCGKPATDASHSRGKKANPELRFVLLNLEHFCGDCHRWWEIHPVERYEWLIENHPEAAAAINAQAWLELNRGKARVIPQFPSLRGKAVPA